jgi:hypothetical protein
MNFGEVGLKCFGLSTSPKICMFKPILECGIVRDVALWECLILWSEVFISRIRPL